MKILVCSDSHGYSKNIIEAVKLESPDMLIHLGDGEQDLTDVSSRFPELRIENVRGNCDAYSSSPAKRITEADKTRIFSVHGHTYGVAENSFSDLKYEALGIHPEINVVLFGHTHIPMTDYTFGMYFMNPGTCGNVPGPTYGIMEISGGKISVKIRHMQD